MKRQPDGYITQTLSIVLLLGVMSYISIRLISLSLWLLLKKKMRYPPIITNTHPNALTFVDTKSTTQRKQLRYVELSTNSSHNIITSSKIHFHLQNQSKVWRTWCSRYGLLFQNPMMPFSKLPANTYIDHGRVQRSTMKQKPILCVPCASKIIPSQRCFSSAHNNRELVRFDSDSATTVVDNCANVCVVNDISMLTNLTKPTSSDACQTVGGAPLPQWIGTWNVSWKDDTGSTHKYALPDCQFQPQSPVNILSTSRLQMFFEDYDTVTGGGTTILSSLGHSIFRWDHGKYVRRIEHPASSIPEMAINEGTNIFSFFIRIFRTVKDDITP